MLLELVQSLRRAPLGELGPLSHRAASEIERLEAERVRLTAEVSRLNALIDNSSVLTDTEVAAHRVVAAVVDEGRNPAHHRRTMASHRVQWPTLWAALDELCRVTASGRTGVKA